MDSTSSPEEILRFWSNQYRELKQAEIHETLTDEGMEYRFARIATTKGVTLDAVLKGDMRLDGYIEGAKNSGLWSLHASVDQAFHNILREGNGALLPPSNFLGMI